MLKPGIKVGSTDWKSRLEESGSRYCEVWYNVQAPEKYVYLFAYLTSHHINTGLHFWGTIDDIWEPNVAYPGSTLDKTLNLIMHTIDIAASNKFHYVNIHCGNTRLIQLNLEKQLFVADRTQPEIPLNQATHIQQQSLLILNSYAQSRGVLFLVETVPANMPTLGFNESPNAHLKITSQYSLPVRILVDRAKQDHISVTNDFCHIFADEFDQPLDQLWQALWDKSVTLAPYTKLVHVNTVIPPYDGTDSHHGITSKDFRQPGIFPTRPKLIQLLSLFKHRNDVWVINEPTDDHVANYFALKKLLPPD